MATKLQDSLVRKIQEIRELKDTIKDLHAQSERDKEFYQQQLQQFKNDAVELEVAIKKCILLENKVEQLQDNFDKYMDRYHSTRVTAECLAEAIYYMIKANKNGER